MHRNRFWRVYIPEEGISVVSTIGNGGKLASLEVAL
jgi:hypothetical protein